MVGIFFFFAGWCELSVLFLSFESACPVLSLGFWSRWDFGRNFILGGNISTQTPIFVDLLILVEGGRQNVWVDRLYPALRTWGGSTCSQDRIHPVFFGVGVCGVGEKACCYCKNLRCEGGTTPEGRDALEVLSSLLSKPKWPSHSRAQCLRRSFFYEPEMKDIICIRTVLCPLRHCFISDVEELIWNAYVAQIHCYCVQTQQTCPATMELKRKGNAQEEFLTVLHTPKTLCLSHRCYSCWWVFRVYRTKSVSLFPTRWRRNVKR